MTASREAQQRAARERKRVREYLAMIRASRDAGVDEEAREYERNLANDFAALVERVEAAEQSVQHHEHEATEWRKGLRAAVRSSDEKWAAWEAAEERLAALEAALRPFAEFGARNTKAQSGQGWYWRDRTHYESISTWFGPSDLGRAAAALGHAESLLSSPREETMRRFELTIGVYASDESELPVTFEDWLRLAFGDLAIDQILASPTTLERIVETRYPLSADVIEKRQGMNRPWA